MTDRLLRSAAGAVEYPRRGSESWSTDRKHQLLQPEPTLWLLRHYVLMTSSTIHGTHYTYYVNTCVPLAVAAQVPRVN